MRLPGDLRIVPLAIALIATLTGCVGGSAGESFGPDAYYFPGDPAPIAAPAPQRAAPVQANTGPMDDYPQMLGEPYTVDGQVFTPADVLSYDTVGYATVDPQGGAGITVSHKTLPLPSYVEITSLDSGRTVLARVERRGPMTASRIIGLSPGAQSALGIGEGAPVRVRRTNPPEFDRAALRQGQAAGARLDTPDTLLSVLRRQLPERGSVSLARTSPRPSGADTATPYRTPGAARDDFDTAFATIEPGRSTVSPPQQAGVQPRTSYALAPIGETPTGTQTPRPVEVARLPQARPSYRPPVPSQGQAYPVQQTLPAPQPTQQAPARVARIVIENGYVVQAAAFSVQSNAIRAADRLEGYVVESGRFYRVRMGPYATREEAEAGLAKARAAGYSDARIYQDER